MSGFKGDAAMLKADVPPILADLAARAKSRGELTSKFAQVDTLNGCGFMVRLQGSSMRYAIRHDGRNNCCKAYELKVNNLPAYGIGISSMPIWARLNFKANMDDIVENYYGLAWEHEDVRIISWTADTTNWIRAVIEVEGFTNRFEMPLGRMRHNNSTGLYPGMLDDLSSEFWNDGEATGVLVDA